MALSGTSTGRTSRSTTVLSYNVLYIVFLVLSSITQTVAWELEFRPGTPDMGLFRRMEMEGEIHIDMGPPPPVPQHGLLRRAAASDTSSTSSTATHSKSTSASSVTDSVTSITPTSSTSSQSSSSSTSSSTSTDTSFSALPTPFDTSLGNNFTASSCPTFFNTFLNNATFKTCLPVSLLLQNSIGFFKAMRSGSALDTVLDASCQSSLVICSPLMSSIADQLIDNSNCGQDYGRQNPVVMQAYSGLISYEPLYNATCLKDKTTKNYCFAEAVVNNTNAADLYPYYTALGIPLPTTAQPTCNSCLQKTMQIFAGYAQQKDQPLAKTYLSCASQIDTTCGASFANTNVQVAVATGAGTRSTTSTLQIVSLTVVLALFALV